MVGSEEGHVFLATASALVVDRHCKARKSCAVLGNGSQINFTSKGLANLLQLPLKKAMLPVSGIGTCCVYSVFSVTVKVRSRTMRFDTNLVCYVHPVVVERLTSCASPKNGWKIPTDYESKLADPAFSEAKNIDLLIGGDIFFELFGPTRIPLSK